jgi:hypothetical protein
LADQIIALTAATSGWLDEIPPNRARQVVDRAVTGVRAEVPQVASALDEGNRPDGEWAAMIKGFIDRALAATAHDAISRTGATS